ncbi:MAG: hypothetical protein ACK5M7_21170 [Draconibacterium sp.]
MKVNYAIIPECYADTNLVETITNSFNSFNHQKSCNEVSRTMQSPRLNDAFALGIIDKDKRSIKYMESFQPVIQKENLYLFKHPDKHHYIIQIYPAIEKFILDSVEETGLNIENFGLPGELEALKKITKRQTSRNNSSLRRLFIELKNNNAKQIVILSKWISYLKEHTYNSNMEEIKEY